MSLYGDIPETHRTLAKSLIDMESNTDLDKELPKELAAKIYTCLAHDWLQIHMEEKAIELIEKSNKICPGYFSDTIKLHMEQNQDFSKIAKAINILLMQLAIDRLKEIVK